MHERASVARSRTCENPFRAGEEERCQAVLLVGRTRGQ